MFSGVEENSVDEVEARSGARSSGAVLHADTDRLLLPTKVAPVSELDREGFRDRALAPKAHVQEGLRVLAEEKNDPDAKVKLLLDGFMALSSLCPLSSNLRH